MCSGRCLIQLIVFGACVLTAAAGCTSASISSQPTAGGHHVKRPALYSRLPLAVRNAGSVTFGTDISYPPFEYYASNNRTPIGFDIDLAHALGLALGIRVKIEQVSFAEIPVELNADRFDAGISAIGDTKLRHGEADFIDYVKVLGAIIVKRGDSAAPTSLPDLCGHSVAVQTGSDEVTIATHQSHVCVREGKPAVAIQMFPEEPAQVLAVDSGRAEALIVDTGVGSYLVKQSGGVLVMARPFGPPSFDGIAVRKDDPQLINALKAAIQDLMVNGTYQRLIKKWGFGYNTLTKVTVNAGS